jgi:competence protein ComEC
MVVSMTIELFMMLPMAVYFHRVTLVALPVNLLIVPFLGLLLPCALFTFAAIMLLPSIAFLPAEATVLLLHAATRIVSIFAATRAAEWRLPMPNPGAIVLWIALCIAAIFLVRLRRAGLIAACASLALAAVIIVFPRSIRYRPHQLKITAIDVAQGDALLVVTPEGKDTAHRCGRPGRRVARLEFRRR